MDKEEFKFSHAGICPVCEQSVQFTADGPYFRNTLYCSHCKTLPRHRALFHVLKSYCPNWRTSNIHESSPGWDYASQRLFNQCPGYVASQYDPNHPMGSVVPSPQMHAKKFRCEDLEKQTFGDGEFDVVITQDVFEHLFAPDKAVAEIARTLKPGGIFLCTVPIILKTKPSRRRAKLVNGQIVNSMPPEFHGNPVDPRGSIVTIDWGYDIVSYLQHHSGLSFVLAQMDNIDIGVRADLIEVLVGIKQPVFETA